MTACIEISAWILALICSCIALLSAYKIKRNWDTNATYIGMIFYILTCVFSSVFVFSCVIYYIIPYIPCIKVIP